MVLLFRSSNVRAAAELGVAYSQSVENEFATACDNADGSTDDIRVSSNASDDSAAKEADEKARSHPPWLSESIPNDFTVSQQH